MLDSENGVDLPQLVRDRVKLRAHTSEGVDAQDLLVPFLCEDDYRRDPFAGVI